MRKSIGAAFHRNGFAVVALASVVLSACGAGSSHPSVTSPVPLPRPTTTKQDISKQNLAYLWPLTVDHGTIECKDHGQAVFTAPSGKTYALNEKAQQAGISSIEPLHATGSDHSGISLGALRSKALELCTVGN